MKILEKKKKMKSILQTLYNGELSPVDKTMLSNPKLKAKTDMAVEIEESLIRRLDIESKNLFEALSEIQADMAIISGEERFVDGFKMGMRIAMESIFDNGFPE